VVGSRILLGNIVRKSRKCSIQFLLVVGQAISHGGEILGGGLMRI